jgi:hypothetical protein
LAEDEEAFVGGEGEFVVAVEAAAVVDPSIGGFDDPPAWLDAEPAGGFGCGHDVDADAGFGRGVGDRGVGVALVEPNVGDGRCGRFRPAWELGEVARSCTLASVTVAATGMPALSMRMWRCAPSTFLAPLHPRGPVTGDALAEDESTTAVVGRLRRPERVRTSAGVAASTLAQIPARHRRRKCLPAAEQPTVKSCGRCRQGQPVRSTSKIASR